MLRPFIPCWISNPKTRISKTCLYTADCMTSNAFCNIHIKSSNRVDIFGEPYPHHSSRESHYIHEAKSKFHWKWNLTMSVTSAVAESLFVTCFFSLSRWVFTGNVTIRAEKLNLQSGRTKKSSIEWVIEFFEQNATSSVLLHPSAIFSWLMSSVDSKGTYEPCGCDCHTFQEQLPLLRSTLFLSLSTFHSSVRSRKDRHWHEQVPPSLDPANRFERNRKSCNYARNILCVTLAVSTRR